MDISYAFYFPFLPPIPHFLPIFLPIFLPPPLFFTIRFLSSPVRCLPQQDEHDKLRLSVADLAERVQLGEQAWPLLGPLALIQTESEQCAIRRKNTFNNKLEGAC